MFRISLGQMGSQSSSVLFPVKLFRATHFVSVHQNAYIAPAIASTVRDYLFKNICVVVLPTLFLGCERREVCFSTSM